MATQNSVLLAFVSRTALHRTALRNAAALGVAALLSLPLLSGCGGGEGIKATAGNGNDVGGTVIMTLPAEPRTMFPPAIDDSQGNQIASALFDKLADIGPDLNTLGDAGFKPRLATGWTWASDSLSISFALSPRARWHDGVAFSSKDVVYTFRAYTDTATGSVKTSQVSNIDSVSAPDSLTAVFWFKRRMPQQFLDATYHMFMLPSHLLAMVPMKELNASPFASSPVGTGQFRFVRWLRKERLEILADTANWHNRPKLDRVVWMFTDNYPASTIQLFKGDADVFEKLQLDNLAKVANDPNLRSRPYESLVYSYIGFQLKARKDRKQPHQIFGDVRVRRALSMAIDRDQLMRSVFDTLASLSIGPSPKSLFPNFAATHVIGFDVTHAKALLDSAGWMMAPGQPVRSKDGKPLAFDLMVSTSSPTKIQYATLLQQALKGIGVTMNVEQVEPRTVGARFEAHDFDAALSGWQVDPGLQGLRQRYGSTGANNFNGYENPRFDALLNNALAAVDKKKSNALWAQTFQQIIDDAPSVWLYEEKLIAGMHKRLRSVQLQADNPYAGLASWTIDPSMRIDRDRVGLGGGR